MTIIASTGISVDSQFHDDPDSNFEHKSIEVGEAPCEGCSFRTYCREELTACNQFYKYYHRNDQGPRHENDFPDRKTHDLICEDMENETLFIESLDKLNEKIKLGEGK